MEAEEKKTRQWRYLQDLANGGIAPPTPALDSCNQEYLWGCESVKLKNEASSWQTWEEVG